MTESFLNQDFRDLLLALSAASVRFVVVGAYAMAVHGQPRATGDLDVWTEATPENAQRVYRALKEFGAPLHQVTEADFASPGIVFQIGLPPRRIDILTAIDGVEFCIAWSARVAAKYGDARFDVIGKADLIANKRATGRPKDVLDADVLERGHR
jgi:hypothetical protein